MWRWCCRSLWTTRTSRLLSCCCGRKAYTSATHCSMRYARESIGSSSCSLTTQASVERCWESTGPHRSELSLRTRVATTRLTCHLWCWLLTATSSRYYSCCCREVRVSSDHTHSPAAVPAAAVRTPRTLNVTHYCASTPTARCPARPGSHWPALTLYWPRSDCPGNSTTSQCAKTSSRYYYTRWPKTLKKKTLITFIVDKWTVI